MPGGDPPAGRSSLIDWPVRTVTVDGEELLKSREEIMEILEAFDLTNGFRAAAELAGCSPNTVKLWVDRRDAGGLPPSSGPVRRERLTDPFLDKIEELVERSRGRIRADVCFDKLRSMGFEGSERTVRRAVAEANEHHERGRRRVYR